MKSLLRRWQLVCLCPAAVWLLVSVPAPADAAHFVYDSGGFSGQRGLGMSFGDMRDDGWISRWDPGQTPAPAAAYDELQLYDPYVGQAILHTLQEGSATTAASQLTIRNHGRVEAEAYSAGTSIHPWEVYSGSGNQGHADSTLEQLAYRIEPTQPDEEYGDPVWVTVYADYGVHHLINTSGYGTWTDRAGFHVKGMLSGPYPAPLTVSVRSDEGVRDRPVLRAAENFTRSARVFSGERIAARIGETIVFDGSVLPWMTIYDEEAEAGVPVGVVERAVSDMTLNTSATVSEGDEFGLVGPATIHDTHRHILTRNSAGTTMTDPEVQEAAPWAADDLLGWSGATQASEIETYWLGGSGRVDASDDTMAEGYSYAESVYSVDFTLEESSAYQLAMILDGGPGGWSSFQLEGPTSLFYYKQPSDWWIPRYQTGQLLAGEYTLQVNATANFEAADGEDAWANFDFDLTLGTPERVLRPDPVGTLIHNDFDMGETPEGLGWSVETDGENGVVAIVFNPMTEETVLELFDPDDDPVSISQMIDVGSVLSIDMEYYFAMPGKLVILLEDLPLAAIYAESASDGYTLFSESFELADYGLTPGNDMELTLRAEALIGNDPLVFLDNLLVWTQVPEPSSAMMALAALVFWSITLASRRRS